MILKRSTLFLLVVFFIFLAIVFIEQSKTAPELLSQGVLYEEGVRIDPTKEGKFPHSPELLNPSGFINTDGKEIKLSDFRGKVVLVDFWTYSCINCIRTIPHLSAWHDTYSDKGLVIVGIHTPEFSFEKEYDNVQAAVTKYGIKYPVVLDNDYTNWGLFRNRYWPRKYLIDVDGYIRYDHIGEGAYDQTEKKIQDLLSEAGLLRKDMPVSSLEDQTPRVPMTPELYAGYEFALSRGQHLGNAEDFQKDVVHDYVFPADVPGAKILLDGSWQAKPESLRSADANASLRVTVTASSVFAVLSPSYGVDSVEMDVLVNGKYLSSESAGEDIFFDGERSYVLVDEPRLYRLREGSYGWYTLTLDPKDAGLELSAFTFG